MANQHTPFLDRIMANVMPEPNSGCWLWTGVVRGNDMRPVARREGRPVSVYRALYEIHHGPIPAGLFACHKCDVPLCVNPAHIFIGTARDNARDCASKRRNPAQTNPDAARQRLLRHAITAPNPRRALGPRGDRIIPLSAFDSIQERVNGGVSTGVVAREFGVSQQAVRQLVNRINARAALAKARQP